jgi:hypothetical protein
LENTPLLLLLLLLSIGVPGREGFLLSFLERVVFNF